MTTEQKIEGSIQFEELMNSSLHKDAIAYGIALIDTMDSHEDCELISHILFSIGTAYRHLSDYSSSLHYYEQSLLGFKENHLLKEISKVLRNMGIVHKLLSDYPQALLLYSQSLSIAEENSDSDEIAKNLSNIGNVYYSLSDFSKALNNYQRALEINEHIGNVDEIAKNLLNIGNVYNVLSTYHTALEYYERSLKLLVDSKDTNAIAANLLNIGNVYDELSDYKNAMRYYEDALKRFKETGNKDGIAISLGSIGSVYNYQSDYLRALEYYERALSLASEIGRKDAVAINTLNIGINHYHLQNYNISIEYISKAINIHNDIGDRKGLMECTYHFSQIYERMGDIEKAYVYFKEYIAVKDEIHSEEAKQKAMLFDQKRILEEDERERQLKLVRFKEQERIFHNILPVSIANRLIEGEKSIAESFENVSVFFSDIVGFTSLSSGMKPSELVQELNAIFSAFDRLAPKYGLEKIKTIGDAYMAVCGVPEAFEDHQYRTSMFAIEAKEILQTLDLGENFKGLQIRIGLHCGSVVAGIIGEKKFTYDVWGDAVNIASRMESTSEGGRIQVSEAFARSIDHHPEFSLIRREAINIKGKGMMNTFWLEKRL